MNASRSKCHGTACPIRDDCLRFTATPHPTDQWYTYPEQVGHECSEMIPNARTLPPPRSGEDHPPYNARWLDSHE